MSAEIARLLQDEYSSQITLLQVAATVEDGEAFLTEWGSNHGLDDTELRVETGDVETTIEQTAQECSMVVIGAAKKGLLARLV